ncbi:hypothetical protein [Oleiharenicola lentus]|uniref:hypothetical protein n=1 Tax=Oleiharenicola lentus TaxID=2508720 RepID=UPI003F676B44
MIAEVETVRPLLSRDALLAVGFCLIFAGIILRSFARSAQRTLDYRKQHSLHRASLAEANAETARRASAVEKHLPKIANGVVLLGLAIIVAAFFRH